MHYWPTYGNSTATKRKYILTIEVTVKDNNIEQALRSLKKRMQREGLFREMKLRKHYEKPSLRRAREKEESIRRSRKLKRRNNDY